MNIKTIRRIGFLCGILCVIAGLALLIMDQCCIEDNSYRLYSCLVMAVGALFIIINVPINKKKKHE